MADWTIPDAALAIGTATSGLTVTVTGYATPVTAGDLLTVSGIWYGGGASGTTVSATDNNGKTYTQVGNSPSTYLSAAGQSYLLYRVADGGEGGTVTVTFGDTIVVASGLFKRFQPPSGSVVLDDNQKASGTTPATPWTISSPSVAVTGSNDLGFAVTAYSAAIASANTPWAAGLAGSFGEFWTWDLGVTSSQAVNFSGNADNASYTDIAASFRFDGGGGGGGPALYESSYSILEPQTNPSTISQW